MCIAPISIKHSLQTGQTKTVVVPCGHCPECRASYQSKFAALSVLECLDYDCVAFVTLTYNQDCLPVAWTDTSRDDSLHAFQRGRDCYPWQLDEWKNNGCSVQPTDDGCLVCPSLYREDVKNLLKRFRAKHPDLKVRFAAFGEYGEQFSRPHYHCLFYGFDNILAAELCDAWHFGFTNFSIIPAFNDDGSSGFNAVSQYVSKYVGKCDRLPEFVRLGFAQKPRRQSSRNFGLKYVNEHLDDMRNFISPEIASRAIDFPKLLNEKNVLL